MTNGKYKEVLGKRQMNLQRNYRETANGKLQRNYRDDSLKIGKEIGQWKICKAIIGTLQMENLPKIKGTLPIGISN